MKLRIDLHIHDERAGNGDSAILRDIHRVVGAVLAQGKVTMGKIEDARQELIEINEATNRQAEASTRLAEVSNEIAADIDSLIQHAESGGLTDADLETLRALKARAVQQATDAEGQAQFLRTVADKHTPTATPPVEG